WGAAMATKGQLEERLRTELSRLYKETTGRGASRVTVDIVRDMILLRYEDALLPLERTYLRLPDGEHRVQALRQWLLDANRQAMIEIIEHVTGVGVLALWGHLHIQTGTRFGLVLLEEDLEAKLKAEPNADRLLSWRR
ncbi:MAG TPA: DUF2294 domain-containing protein, partial [Porticoccaceae bacterium]